MTRVVHGDRRRNIGTLAAAVAATAAAAVSGRRGRAISGGGRNGGGGGNSSSQSGSAAGEAGRNETDTSAHTLSQIPVHRCMCRHVSVGMLWAAFWCLLIIHAGLLLLVKLTDETGTHMPPRISTHMPTRMSP